MGKLGELKRRLLQEGGPMCECCHQWEAEHAAHVFVGSRSRHREWDTRPENIALVCLICHGFDIPDEQYDPDRYYQNRVNTHDFRQRYMAVQKERYDMQAWWNERPAKLKNKELEVLLNDNRP